MGKKARLRAWPHHSHEHCVSGETSSAPTPSISPGPSIGKFSPSKNSNCTAWLVPCWFLDLTICMPSPCQFSWCQASNRSYWQWLWQETWAWLGPWNMLNNTKELLLYYANPKIHSMVNFNLRDLLAISATIKELWNLNELPDSCAVTSGYFAKAPKSSQNPWYPQSWEP